MTETGGTPEHGRPFVSRFGKLVLADEAFEAWTSGDLARMLAALELQTNEIDRHFLLQGLVQETYRRRSDPAMRELCIHVGRQHVAEFPSLCPALREDFKDVWEQGLPRVVTFQCLATVIAEQGMFDEAVKVCELAIAYGRTDGTRGGFEARIERIRKTQQKRRRRET